MIRRKAPEGFKYCPRCKKVLSESAFSKNKTHPDGLQGECKKCRVILKKERRNKGYRKRSKPWLRRDKRKHNARQFAEKYIILAEFCELCPEDDERSACERHHPDYDEPLIIVSVCSECHQWIDK